MLEFRKTMDPRSRDIYRDGTFIGMLQWHDTPKFVAHLSTGVSLTLGEMELCIQEYKKISKVEKKPKNEGSYRTTDEILESNPWLRAEDL